MSARVEPARTARIRRRRSRRALMLLVCAGVVVMAGLGAEGLRRSDLPRRVIVRELERATGLRVHIGAAHVGWGGHARLDDLEVRTALDDAPVLVAPRLDVRTNALLGIVAWGVRIDEVALHEPRVDAREDERGVWNLERVVETVRAAQNMGASGAPGAWPRVVVERGEVSVVRFNGAGAIVPLRIDGTPIGASGWACELNAGGVSAEVRLATGTLEHRARVRVRGADELVGLWAPAQAMPLTLDASWEGDVETGGVHGRVRLDRLSAGGVDVSGGVDVAATRDTVDAGLHDVRIGGPAMPWGPWLIGSGALRLNGDRLSAARMRITGALGVIEVSGGFYLGWDAGSGQIVWRSDGPVAHETSMSIDIARGTLDRWHVEGDFDSSGGWSGARWRSRGRANAEIDGETLSRASVRAERLEVDRGARSVVLDGLSLGARLSGSRLTLEDVVLPGATDPRVVAEADLDTMGWRAEVSVPRWHVPALGETLGVQFAASGVARRGDVRYVALTSPWGSVRGTAMFDLDSAEPIAARLVARVPVKDEPGTAYSADVLVGATLEPWRIDVTGEARTPLMVVGRQDFEPVRATFEGQASAAGAIVRTGDAAMLGGRASATFRVGPAWDAVEVEGQADGIEVRRALALAVDAPPVAGTFGARIRARAPGWALDRVEGDAEWRVAGLADAPWTPALEGGGSATYADGRVRVHAISLDAPGGAGVRGEVSLDLARRDQLLVGVRATRWPLEWPEHGVACVADIGVDARVDLGARAAFGTIGVDGSATLNGRDLGRVRADADVRGRVVDVHQFRADVMGGTVSGTGSVDVDRWTASTAHFELGDIDLSALREHVPGAGGFDGIARGTLKIDPALDGRAVGPLQAHADLTIESGRIYGVALPHVTADVYTGAGAVVLDPLEARIAGGTARIWARASHHADEVFVQSNVNAENIDLAAIVSAVEPASPPTPGKLSVRASMGGYMDAPHRAFGEAVVTLTEADLQPAPAFARVYSLLRIERSARDARGTGRLRARLENDALVISRLHYFNHGTDLLGSGRIERVWDGGASPVRGAMAATARPLKGSRLPLGPEVDRMIFAALKDAATVRIDGTLADPAVRVAPLAEVQDWIGGVFGVRGE